MDVCIYMEVYFIIFLLVIKTIYYYIYFKIKEDYI